jgi:hypothetical protein
VVVDDLLDAATLDDLRRFCRESAVWNNIQSGYLGAYFFDGFASGLLLRLARELRERFPKIIPGLPLQMLWGYKYDHQLQGIGVHADAAAVNINFWITEDEANLEPDGGGLLVYRHTAPPDWEFDRFNRDPAEIMRYLDSVGSEPIRIPHRANRAVIFDSDLFHAAALPRRLPQSARQHHPALRAALGGLILSGRTQRDAGAARRWRSRSASPGTPPGRRIPRR